MSADRGRGPAAFGGPDVVVRATDGTDATDATDEEVAAIVAAIEVAWPRRSTVLAAEEPSRWRFSGRWWSKPVPLRRSRPW